MRNGLLPLSLCLAAMIWVSGCMVHEKVTPPLDRGVKEEDRGVIQAESRYYHFTEAQLQRKKRNLDKAIFHLNKAIEQDPESLYLQKEIAILYLENKESLKALNTVEQILKREPENLDGLIMYARIKQSLKQLEDAKEAYETGRTVREVALKRKLLPEKEINNLIEKIVTVDMNEIKKGR